MTSSRISLSTKNVSRAFSRSAVGYDILTQLHRQVADGLMEKVLTLPVPGRGIDIGCGTGHLTSELKRQLPRTEVIGLDFSQGMLEQAQKKYPGLQWVLADLHQLPFDEKTMDLIVSNLAYQWAADLPVAFAEAHRVLSAKGSLSAALFGYHTCQELFASLEAGGPGLRGFNRLPTIEDVKAALSRAGFLDFLVEREEGRLPFKDIWELLSWLKAIGANRLSDGRFIGAEALGKANAYGLKNHPLNEGVGITFEVIWITAHA